MISNHRKIKCGNKKAIQLKKDNNTFNKFEIHARIELYDAS